MNKIFTALAGCLLAITPYISDAQNDPEILKDFDSSITNIVTTIQFDDHINIMEVARSNDKLDVIAVNDQMKVLWKTSLKGYALTVAKFKDKVLAVAATDFSDTKGTNNTYKGFLLDAATGKVLLEKEILHDQDDYDEQPTFIEDPKGKFFKIGVRETGIKHKTFTTTRFDDNAARTTRNITLLDYNEKLESTSFKPALNDGVVASITHNDFGDLFICWFKPNNTLTIVKYPENKSDPLGITGKELDLGLSADKDGTEYSFHLFPSSSHHDVIYFVIMHRTKSKEQELGVGKYDFSNNRDEYVKEELNKEHMKQLEKSTIFDSADKNDKPDFGSPAHLYVSYAGEKNGNAVVAVSGMYSEQGSMGTWVIQTSILLNIYDSNLALVHQTAVPSWSAGAGKSFSTGYNLDSNFLYVIANQKDGSTSLKSILGKLNLSSGKWEYMNWLSKKKISGAHPSVGNGVMWFPGSLIVPYEGGASMINKKVDLQLAKYAYPSAMN